MEYPISFGLSMLIVIIVNYLNQVASLYLEVNSCGVNINSKIIERKFEH
jgi:hypothetical protein